MAILMHDDGPFQIRVVRRKKARTVDGPAAYVELHARRTPIRRRQKVGVAGTAAVLRFSPQIIVASATLSEIVDLEITVCLVEAVTVKDVVCQIRPIEQIGRGGRSVIRRRQREIHWKSAGQGRAAIRLRSRGRVKTKYVQIGIHIIAAQSRVSGRTRVVPAQRRRQGIRRVAQSLAPVERRCWRSLIRTFKRLRIDLVIGRGYPVESRPDFPGLGIDRKVVDMLAIGCVNLEIPDQTRELVPDRQPHQPHHYVFGGQFGLGEPRRLLRIRA